MQTRRAPRPWVYVVDLTVANRPAPSTLKHRPLNAMGFVQSMPNPVPQFGAALVADREATAEETHGR